MLVTGSTTSDESRIVLDEQLFDEFRREADSGHTALREWGVLPVPKREHSIRYHWCSAADRAT